MIKNLTSENYIKEILKLIKDEKTFDQKYYGPGWEVKSDEGTAHLSIVAPNGDAVSLTSSVNTL